MVPELPTEVVHMIIDNFAPTEFCLLSKSDYEALRSCALTCRRWLRRSQHHLRKLDTMSIRSSEQLQKISRTLSSSPTDQHIMTPAKTMRLSALHCAAKEWRHLVPLTLGKNRLRHMRELEIHGAGWHKVALHHAVFLAGFSSFIQVTALELYKCTFSTFQQFQHLVSALPALQRLYLTSVMAASMPSPPQLLPAIPGPAKSLLQLLTVSLGYTDNFTRDHHWFAAALNLWLVSLSSPHTIKGRYYTRIWGDELRDEHKEAASRTLVQDIGHWLDSLEVNYDIQRKPLGFDLSRSNNLRSFTVTLWYPHDFDSTLNVHIQETLKTLPEQNKLEYLDIVVFVDYLSEDHPHYSFVSCAELHSWRRFVEALDAEREHFPQLQALYLKFNIPEGHTDITMDEALAEVEAASAPLSERGVNVYLDWDIS